MKAHSSLLTAQNDNTSNKNVSTWIFILEKCIPVFGTKSYLGSTLEAGWGQRLFFENIWINTYDFESLFEKQTTYCTYNIIAFF